MGARSNQHHQERTNNTEKKKKKKKTTTKKVVVQQKVGELQLGRLQLVEKAPWDSLAVRSSYENNEPGLCTIPSRQQLSSPIWLVLRRWRVTRTNKLFRIRLNSFRIVLGVNKNTRTKHPAYRSIFVFSSKQKCVRVVKKARTTPPGRSETPSNARPK